MKIVTVFLLVVIVLFGGIALLLLHALGYNAIAALILFPLALGASLFCAALVHELGHALSGIRNGLRVWMVGVIPFLIRREATEWQIHFAPASGILGFVGLIIDSPNQSRMRVALRRMYRAGPIANIISGLICSLITYQVFARSLNVGGDLPSGYRMAFILGLSAFSVTSLFVGVYSLVPRTTPSGRTDGAMLRYLQQPSGAEVVRQLQWLGQLQLGHRWPKEWTANEVTVLSHIANESAGDDVALELRMAASRLLALAYLDHGQTEAGLGVLEPLSTLSEPTSSKSSNDFHQGLALLASLHALHRADVDAAQASLNRIPAKSPARYLPIVVSTQVLIALSSGEAAAHHRQLDVAIGLAKRLSMLFPAMTPHLEIAAAIRDRVIGRDRPTASAVQNDSLTRQLGAP